MNSNYNKLLPKYSKAKYKHILQKRQQYKQRLIKKRLRLNNKKILFLSTRYSKIKDYRFKLQIYHNYLKNEFKNIISLKKKKFKTNEEKLLNNSFLNKIVWYNYLKGKKYLRSNFFNLAIKKVMLNIQKIKKRRDWKYNKFWIIKKKGSRIRKNKKIRLLFNNNVESNFDKSAFTLISKEFLNSPKFLKSKPLAFSLKVNKFIKHFF